MTDGDIDYSKYTPRELEEARAGINARKYPKNYANLSLAFAKLKQTLPPAPQPERTPAVDPSENDEPAPKYDANGRYIPNHITKGERAGYLIFSLLLLAYGTYGVWANDLYVPGRRSRGIHLQDSPAWMMYGAILCACLVMLSVIADHYDRRNNEKNYRLFADIFKVIGWMLFGVSLLFNIIREPA